MPRNGTSIIDSDGHLIESVPELAEFLSPDLRHRVLNPSRNREGLFPSIDGFHGPRVPRSARGGDRQYVTASEHRTGSGEDYQAFLEKAGVERAILYCSEGLSVGFIQNAEYAIQVCRAYNDYVAERYRKVSDRLHPMALIPMQQVSAAVDELKRAVKELGLPGAMLPSTGLPLHLAHEYYWPIYEAAAEMDCPLAIHGGSSRGIGIDSYSVFRGAHVLHHPVPLMIALTGLIYHGVLDRYPVRVAFLEGGCAWLVCILDRMERNEEIMGVETTRQLTDYLAGGQIQIGCEGNDVSLPYLARRVGIEPFAYSSDYPHEVDLVAAKHEIEETLEHPELSEADKAAVLGENARRFYGLEKAARTPATAGTA